MGCSGHQHILEGAEDVRSDGAPLVVGHEPAVRALAPEDVEMVEPEVGHDLLELSLREGRTSQLCRGHLAQDAAWRLFSELTAESASLFVIQGGAVL
jgi:hypothetical protein